MCAAYHGHDDVADDLLRGGVVIEFANWRRDRPTTIQTSDGAQNPP